MVVASIVITTIIVFILVDLLLRFMLEKHREARVRREREEALDTGLRLDVSDEAPTLKRVKVDRPAARILAVDDEAVILDGFRKMLVLGGYSIDTVESGPEALGLIRRNDYDFVFTDLRMPGMDGVEVTKAVRHLRPDIDVIVITGYASVDTAVETVGQGAMDYVEKPFTENELLDFVKRAVIRRRENRAREMRHEIRLVRPGSGASKSRFALNVPAGAFFSQQHAWVTVGLNGMVRIGLDDLMRKVFGPIDRVDLPEIDGNVRKGDALFAVTYGDFILEVPAPLSGKIVAVNTEHADHPEWLAAKPFELSWMCAVDPDDLAGELGDLRIAQDALDWFGEELERYRDLSGDADKKVPGRLVSRFVASLAGLFLLVSALPAPALDNEDAKTTARKPRIPDVVVYSSSIGDVEFQHRSHRKAKCATCHHQIHAEALVTPHDEYLVDSRIRCSDCHDSNPENPGKYYKCSMCHHAEPENIADETLSSKVVLHKSCWTCHETGTGVEASASCETCHVKPAVEN